MQLLLEFLPTPSHGGRLCSIILEWSGKILFLPTPSHGGRRVLLQTPSVPYKDFYPRPHMEGDAGQNGGVLSPDISTHALTWRATKPRSLRIFFQAFLPTPSHGGRHLRQAPGSIARYFYPRPHMEGDAFSLHLCIISAISTHALTWRATYFVDLFLSGKADFYPRPHMEGDVYQQFLNLSHN